MSSQRSAGRRIRSPSDAGDGSARLEVRTLLAGIAVRPLAQSARRAGADAASVDLFGDRDHRRALPVLSLGRAGADGYSAADLLRLCRRVAADEVVYGADLENHPRLVAELADGRRLLGNPPAVLRRVRDPTRVEASLREGGLPAPEVRRQDDPLPSGGEDVGWLRKPLRGGGGRGVRPWRPGEAVGRADYLQRRIPGTPVSLVFLSDGRSGRLLAATEMLVGWSAVGAEGFTYCGSLLRVGGGNLPVPPPGPAGEISWETARRAVVHLSADFGLRGLNGLDAVLDGDTLWPVEVNPRWTASMELLEPGPWDGDPAGPTLFELHRRACGGDLPAEAELREIRVARRWSSLAATGAAGPGVGAGEPGVDGTGQGQEEGTRIVGKAILRAPAAVRTPDLEALDGVVVADVPDPGEKVPAGGPVCTILAAGRDRADCLDRLATSAARIREVLEPREALRPCAAPPTGRPDTGSGWLPTGGPGCRAPEGRLHCPVHRTDARRRPTESRPASERHRTREHRPGAPMSTEERIGTVTHYFDKPQVGAVDLEEVVELGDELHFTGHTTDFRQTITSMEVDHQAVEVAGPGDEVAVKVDQRVREGDEVYRVSSG